MRAVARQFNVHLRTVQRWSARASGTRLDRADPSPKRPGCRRSSRRVEASVEARVLALRRELRDESALWRVRVGGDPAGVAGGGVGGRPDGADDPPDTGMSRGAGRDPSPAVPAAAPRMVPAAGGVEPRRTGQLRPGRWPGDPRRHGRRGAERNEACWGGLVRELADWAESPPVTWLEKGAAGTLAAVRAAGLRRSSTTGPSFQGAHQWPDTFGRGDADVPEPGRHAGLRAAPGDVVPGVDRELQRTMAGEGVVPLRARTYLAVAGVPDPTPVVAAARVRSASPDRERPAGGVGSGTSGNPTWQRRLDGTVIFLRRTDTPTCAASVLVPGRSTCRPTGPIASSGPRSTSRTAAIRVFKLAPPRACGSPAGQRGDVRDARRSDSASDAGILSVADVVSIR